MRQVRFGLIGCGAIAEKHVIALAEIENAELVAVCDTNLENMKRISTLMKNSANLLTFSDYHDLLAQTSLDAVIIASSSGLHGEMSKQAICMGKHVVLEKPMALTLAEADEVLALAKHRGLQIMVCHQLRYRPLIREMKRIIDSNAIGPVYLGTASMQWYRPSEYYTSSSWRGTWRQDGGMLLNQAIHLIDLLVWFFGEPLIAYGELQTIRKEKETEDLALGMFTFPFRRKGLIDANVITYRNNLQTSITVFGEKGTLALGGKSLDRLVRWDMEGDWAKECDPALLLDDRNERIYMYRDFIRVLTTGKGQVLCHGEEGRKTLQATIALYCAARNRSPVALPVSDYSTLEWGELGT